MPIFYRKQPVKSVVRDVTATRAWTTIYQNTTGRPILVLITIYLGRVAAGDSAKAQAELGVASPPSSIVGIIALQPEAPIDSMYAILTFSVPNGYYYNVEKTLGATGEATLYKWIEVEL